MCRSEEDEGLEALIGLFVSCGDASEPFEIAKEVFDEMTPSIHGEIARDWRLAICLGGDHSLCSDRVQQPAQPVVVEALVGKQGLHLDAVDQAVSGDAVMTLARQEREAGKRAERIDESDDLRRQAAARAADGLTASPPLAPVPC